MECLCLLFFASAQAFMARGDSIEMRGEDLPGKQANAAHSSDEPQKDSKVISNACFNLTPS
jgi:hypothetical protein